MNLGGSWQENSVKTLTRVAYPNCFTPWPGRAKVGRPCTRQREIAIFCFIAAAVMGGVYGVAEGGGQSNQPPRSQAAFGPIKHRIATPEHPSSTRDAEDANPAESTSEPKSTPPSGVLTIPHNHPRLWWSKKRLAQARAWYARTKFTPRTNDAIGNALVYVLTGQATFARAAIKTLMNFKIPDERLRQLSVDLYRWNDWVPIVFDWTYNAMTPSERKTFMDRYSRYVDVIRKKAFGGRGYESNNYFWGYFRNELNWALATYYENPKANAILKHVLETRWKKWFLLYASGEGKGGVPQEGSQYGRYMLEYTVVPFTTARLMGRDLYSETGFYQEALYNMIYTTTPAPTLQKGTPRKYYQVFPFSDEEMDGGYPTASIFYYGDFMTAVADNWRDSSAGRYARAWLALVRPPRSPHVAAIDAGGQGREFRSLPLDYYAAGPHYLYSRNRWGPKTTSVLFQLGRTTRAPHYHLDWGTFQVWRNGEWLTKESTGYSQQFAGGTARQTISHNGILFQKIGLANAYNDGPPKLLRLESNTNYAYAAVDLSKGYRAHRSGHKDRDDNPYAGRVVREFVFVKPLEALVILDRVEASGEVMAAKDVVKTFVLHFPELPKLDGSDRVLAKNVSQALRVVTLLPKEAERRVVDESKFSGRHLQGSYYQYRLEVSHKGQKLSYFLHVLQGRDAKGVDIEATVREVNGSWVVQLGHPSLGHAVVVFNKGATSRGGKFGFSPKVSSPRLVPLLDNVQGFKVTGEGPVWETVKTKA
jgi:hypothetical protein